MDIFHSPRHQHVPTSLADSSGTTTRVTSASFATVVTVLGQVDDRFASQLKPALVKILPSRGSLILVKYRN